MVRLKRDYRFGDSFNHMDRSFWDSDFWPGMIPRSSDGNSYPVDFYGDEESYFLVAELPRIKKDDVELKRENAVPTINVTRKKGEGEIAKEFPMTRAITVGDDINPDEVIAKMENGFLTAILPEVEERKPKLVAIS